MAYTYRLYKNISEKKNHYTRYELEHMSTFELQEICMKEKIITRLTKQNNANLKRCELIELLLRYRGIKMFYLQNDLEEAGKQKLEHIVKNRMKLSQLLKLPARIETVATVGICRTDHFTIEHEFDDGMLIGILLNDDKICAVFEVEQDILTLAKQRLWLEPGIYRNLNFVLLDKKSSYLFAKYYNEDISEGMINITLAASEAAIPLFIVKSLKETQDSLFINIGSSTICAAAGFLEYQQQPEYISFNKTCEVCNKCLQCRLCPSIGVVQSLEGQPKFLFGYEAMEYMRLNGFAENMSIFRNMKKILQHGDDEVEIHDRYGNTANVKQREILRALFHYLIDKAEAYTGKKFTSIEMIAEVGFEKCTQASVSELLPEFTVLTNYTTSLSTAFWDISEKKLAIEKEKDTLVYHIGGETSSLTKISYSILNNGFTYHLLANIRRLHYESLFGGENITYRILQLIKILLCKGKDGEKLITDYFQDPCQTVDKNNNKNIIYEKFLSCFDECEEYLPTKFLYNCPQAYKRRQNFFRLWFLAEGIKHYFYSSQKGYVSIEEEFPEYSFFYFFNGDNCQEKRVSLTISLREIEAIILADLYYLTKQFLDPLCDSDGILSDVALKFSGQSCLVDACRTSLSEFTVGRNRRLDSFASGLLKLRSISGAIMLEELKKKGILTHTVEYSVAENSYQLRYCHYDSKEETISLTHKNVYGYIARHINTRSLIFDIYDDKNILKREIELKIDFMQFQPSSYQKVYEQYPFLEEFQPDLDAMREEEIRIFFIKSAMSDFASLPFARRNNELFAGAVNHYLFEDGAEDYFDGLH